MANERERLIERIAEHERYLDNFVDGMAEQSGWDAEQKAVERVILERQAAIAVNFRDLKAALSPSPSESTDKGDAVEQSQRARELLASEFDAIAVEHDQRGHVNAAANVRERAASIRAGKSGSDLIAVKAIERALAASSPRVDEDAIRAALERVEKAARAMPRATPVAGGSSTIHDFRIEAGVVWTLDLALKELDRARALKPTPSPIDAPGDEGLVERLRELARIAHLPRLAVEPDDREGMSWNDHLVYEADPNMRVAFMARSNLTNFRAAYIVEALNAMPELLDRLSRREAAPPIVPDEVEQIISAWAFAHNIDGAARNDLFRRLREAALSSPPAQMGGRDG